MVPSTCQADGARRAEAHRRRFLLEGAAEQGAEVERLVEVVFGAAGHEPGRAAPHDLGALVEGGGDGADGDGRARSVDRRRGQPVDLVAAVVERQLLDGADRQHGSRRQHHAPHAESHPQTVSHRRSLVGPPDGPRTTRINVQWARSERRDTVLPESASGSPWRAPGLAAVPPRSFTRRRVAPIPSGRAEAPAVSRAGSSDRRLAHRHRGGSGGVRRVLADAGRHRNGSADLARRRRGPPKRRHAS